MIDQCLTTKEQKCPVCEYNSGLWNNGTDAGKEQARKQKRKLSYYSNIFVVSDPANPDNEGKVFLYKYGKKIHDKIMEAMKAEFADEEPINPLTSGLVLTSNSKSVRLLVTRTTTAVSLLVLQHSSMTMTNWRRSTTISTISTSSLIPRTSSPTMI